MGEIMKKAIIFLTVFFIVALNPCLALSIDYSGKNYSFQSDYDAIERVANSVFYVSIYDKKMEYSGSASGFVAFQEHLFVTNYHVIRDASYLKIWDEKNNTYILDKVIAFDIRNDLAILGFPAGKKYDSLEFQMNAQLKRGQPVTTIGSPEGMQNTVAFGNISAFPTMNGIKKIQFTAPISHGSSGGVLFDNNGKVIGITTSAITEGQNIGFAIPIDKLEQLYQNEYKKSYETLPSDLNGNTTTNANDKTAESKAKNDKKEIKIGDIILFGKYEQDRNITNGSEAIEWFVLDIQDGKCLLLSKYGLDNKPYNQGANDYKPENVTWEECSLRQWLNKVFLQEAFSSEEQSYIQTVVVENDDLQGNKEWETSGGNNTEDQVFLLSHHEIFDLYLKDKYIAECLVTPYAIGHGAYYYPGYFTDGRVTCMWWSRSPGMYQNNAEEIKFYASGLNKNSQSVSSNNCVRPAIWIDYVFASTSLQIIQK